MNEITEGHPERRVLITRSEPSASALSRALEAEGFASEVAPLVEIERVAAGADELRALAEQQVVIFTSAHAVEHAFALIDCDRILLPTEAAWIAIGAATAKALRGRAIQASTPDAETSEGVLSMPMLADVDRRRVLIVGGAGGRRTLDEGLRARGAALTRATVYRRRAAVAERALGAYRHGRLAAAVVSSAESGRVLARALDVARAEGRFDASSAAAARDVPVVVPSERVAAALAALGFRRTIVSRGASAAAVIAALREIHIERTP